jgi:hypothetical protein
MAAVMTEQSLPADRPFDDREKTREAGKRGAAARWASRLTLERITAELGLLATPEDAMRWAATAFRWTSAQVIPGAAGGACASLIREWQKAFDAKLDRERIEQLERRIEELQEELRRHGPASSGVPVSRRRLDAAAKQLERLPTPGAQPVAPFAGTFIEFLDVAGLAGASWKPWRTFWASAGAHRAAIIDRRPGWRNW